MRGARKTPMVGASQLKEETLKLITRFELASKPKRELYALYREALKAFAATARGTPTRRDALTSLENLEVEGA